MMNPLLRDEIIHGIFAIPAAFFIWHKTKSIKRVCVLFLMVYLIDLDHLIDFWNYWGFNFDVRKFFDIAYFRLSSTAYVLLHAWEWVILLSFIALKRGWRSYYTVTALAIGSHLLYDMITVNSIVFYSIIFRAYNQFSFLP